MDAVYAFTLLAGSGAVIAALFKLLITSKDALIQAKEDAHKLALQQMAAEKAEEVSRKRSYEEVAAEALRSNREMADYVLKMQNKPPMPVLLPPVISESHSPSTEAQRETARIATMRAEMAAIKREMGQEPRKEPEREGEDSSLLPRLPPADVVTSLSSQISAVPEKTAKKVVDELNKLDNKEP